MIPSPAERDICHDSRTQNGSGRILKRSVELITTCECQTRGQPGCHRCLFAAVNRHEIPLVSREVALGMLDEILTGWQSATGRQTARSSGVNLSAVQPVRA